VTYRAAIICVSCVAVSAQVLGAQASRSDPSDTQAWYSAGLTLDLPRKWEASLRYRQRYEGNARLYKGAYVTAEGSWNGWAGATLLASYRRSSVDGGTYHRIAVGAERDASVMDFDLSLRALLANQLANGSDDDEIASDAKRFVRIRAQAKRELAGRLDAYASVEPYIAFGADYLIDNWRNTVGLKFEYAKGRKLDVFYIYRPDYAKSYNRTYHVLGVDFDFTVKLPRR